MLKFFFLFFLVFCSCSKYLVSGDTFDKDEYILGSDESQQEQLDEIDTKDKSF